jgi:predicted dehydrogenase
MVTTTLREPEMRKAITTPVRLAFVGVDNPHGAAWRELLTHFGSEFRLTALVPSYGDATTSLEERYAKIPRFSTVEDLILGADFDAAIICLPNNLAPTAAARLAEAGKHILVEKPAAGSADEIFPLLEILHERPVAFQNGYMWRYDEGAERLRAMVQEGRFGQLISLEMTFVTSDIRRRGSDHYLFDRSICQGGYFNWLACHFLDLLFHVTGQSVVGVTARTDVFGPTSVDVEDGGVAILDLSGGGIATFIGGYWLPRWAGESHWCLRGSERWVHWNPSEPGTGGKLEIHGPQPHWHAMEETFMLPPDSTSGYGGYRGVALLKDWLRSMQTGEPCRNTPETTRTTLELLDAIYESSAQGRRIECQIGPDRWPG